MIKDLLREYLQHHISIVGINGCWSHICENDKVWDSLIMYENLLLSTGRIISSKDLTLWGH